jgi:hypothetical protein
MTSLLARIGAYFFEPEQPDAAPPSAGTPVPAFLPPSSTGSDLPPVLPSASEPSWVGRASDSSATGAASSPGSPPAHSAVPVVAGAAVLGASGVVVPVAAACAGELRARARATAALLCIWQPAVPAAEPEVPVPAAQSPAGATTPGARRLAARLGAHGLPATACGRLAWLALDNEPAAAAGQMERCLIAAGVPVVLAVAGARPPAFERLLADLDLAIAVLPADIDPALRELAVATLRARERAVLPPLPPGPPRWAAMAGLARLRALKVARP